MKLLKGDAHASHCANEGAVAKGENCLPPEWDGPGLAGPNSKTRGAPKKGSIPPDIATVGKNERPGRRCGFPTGVRGAGLSQAGGAEFFVGCDAGFSPKLPTFKNEYRSDD
jgi:hypothetical protein